MSQMVPPWRSGAQPGDDASAIARELDDPATTAERLQQIALERPDFRARIAAHPNCYPELSEWVEQHGQAATAHRAAGLSVEPAPRPQGLLKGFGIAAAIVVPLITAVSITIPVIDQLSQRQSSPEALKVLTAPDPFADAEVIGEANLDDVAGLPQQLDWEIPVTAPIETFPLDNVPDEYGQFSRCSQAQLSWLEEHAHPGMGAGSPAFDVTLHNSSTTGASLPLGNIRFIGEEASSEPIVRFVCPTGGRGAAASGQPFLIKVTGEESLYGEAVSVSGDDIMPEGSPVTLNLAPGEVSVVTLTRDESVDTQRRYEGRFVADLIDGSDAAVVLADKVIFKRAAMEGFYVGFPSGELSAEFVCLSPSSESKLDSRGNRRPAPCSLAQAADILREAAALAKEQ